MSAARQIAAPPPVKSAPAGRQCAADRGERTPDQPFRPRKSDAPHHRRRQSARDKTPNVTYIVRPFNSLERRRFGLQKCKPLRLRQQLPQNPILADRELVSGRQRDFMVVAVEKRPEHSGSVSHAGCNWQCRTLRPTIGHRAEVTMPRMGSKELIPGWISAARALATDVPP